jgi:hypothetical protein
MKKTLTGMIIVLAMAAMAWAQTANLTAPNGGEKWLLKSKHKITWTYTGNTAIKLLLIHKGGILEGAIKTGLQLNAGAFEWTVGVLEDGKTVPAKNDYKVRIKAGNTLLDVSKNTFTIYDSPLYTNFQVQTNIIYANIHGAMKVTSPVKNDKWTIGGTYKITWDKGGSGDTKVGISLYRQGKFVYAIPGFFANTGSHTWTIPGSISIGDYVIKVFTIGDKFQAESGLFSVERPQIHVGVDNYWYVHDEVSNKVGCGLQDHSTQPCAVPGPREILVGFDNYYDSGYCWKYVGHIYRGFLSFDLSEVKGAVVKARLEMVRTTSVHRYGLSASNSSQCIGSVHILDGAWSTGGWNVPSHFYHNLPAAAASDGIVNYDGVKHMTIDITDVVRKWLSGQQANFGLMFVGWDQSYSHNNDACYSAYVVPSGLSVDVE